MAERDLYVLAYREIEGSEREGEREKAREISRVREI
jgi:hypothetical protein